MVELNRRAFFMTGAGALAAQVAPSKQVAVGVIRSGGRGQFLIATFRPGPGVRVAAVCDVYEANRLDALEAGKDTGTSRRRLPLNG